MLVFYHWNLNSDAGFTKSDYGFPPTLRLDVEQSIRDFIWIREHCPYRVYQNLATEEFRAGHTALQEHRWDDGYRHFQRAALHMERFRAPDVLDLTKESYVNCALCALADGRAAEALASVRHAFSLGEGRSTAFQIQDRAKAEDDSQISELENLSQAGRMTNDDLEFAANYLLRHPTPKRMRLAKAILNRFEKVKPGTRLAREYLARCYMSEGLPDEAFKLLEPLASGDAEISHQLTIWRGLLLLKHSRSDPCLFARPECEPGLDACAVSSRGLTLFVNALYPDALRWLLFALELTPSDPFALFGYALVLWKMCYWALAANNMEKAITALNAYPKQFRQISFARADETCPARSYGFDAVQGLTPPYPIFDMSECLARIRRRDPYVSQAIIP